MKYGTININQRLYIGPFNNEYVDITIRSIHDDSRNNVSFLRKNELGCFAIKSKDIKNKYQIQSGMIITNKKYKFVKQFIGVIDIFTNHSTTITVGYKTIIHCGSIRKPVTILRIEDSKGNVLECLRGGDKNTNVHFEFERSKQYITKGERFIFREGRAKGSGYIKKIVL